MSYKKKGCKNNWYKIEKCKNMKKYEKNVVLLAPIVSIILFSIVTSYLGLFHQTNKNWFFFFALISSSLILISCFYSLIKLNRKITALLSPALVVLTFAALSFPKIYDESNYGLSLIREYASAGYFKYQSNFGIYSGAPTNSDSIYINFYKAFGYKGIHIFNVIIYSLLGIYFYELMKKLEIQKNIRTIGTFFLLSCPSIYIFAPTIKSDNMLAYFLMLSFSLLIKVRNNQTNKNIQLYISAILYAFALGIKYTAFYSLPAYLIFVYFFIKKEEDKFGKILFVLIILAVLNLHWMFKNFIQTGNPLFPFLDHLFKSKLEIPYTLEHSNLFSEALYGQKKFSFRESHSIPVLLNTLIHQSWLIIYLIFFAAVYSLIKTKSEVIKPFIWSSIILSIEYTFFLIWELRHIVIINITLFTVVFYFLNKDKNLNERFKSKKYLPSIVLFVLITIVSIHSFYYYKETIKCSFTQKTKMCEMKLLPENQGFAISFLNNYANDNETIATNLSPVYFLKNNFLVISPLIPSLNYTCTGSELDLLYELIQKRIKIVAWKEYDASATYNSEKARNLIFCYDNLNKKITSLADRGRLMKVKQLNDVSIYRVISEKN